MDAWNAWWIDHKNLLEIFFYFADSGVTDALLNWLGERFSKLLSVTFSKVFRVAFFRLS